MSLPKPYYEHDGITIYHGDSRQIVSQLPRPHVVITDPPYQVAAKGCGLAGNRQYLKTITEQSLDAGFDVTLLDEFENWFCFCGKQQLPLLVEKASAVSGNWMLVVWCKTNPTPLTNNNYLPDCEYILHRYAAGRLFGTYQHKSRFFLATRKEGRDASDLS